MLQPGYYAHMAEDEIASELCSEGISPKRVKEAPGNRYDRHTNPQDLLLAFLAGSADIRVGEQLYHCAAGDRLLINGHVLHSGIVGADGCEYLITHMPTLAD